MNCGEFEALIAPLLDGALPESVAERAHAHLESCSRCGGLVAAADRGTPAATPTAPPTPDWDALDDALASAAKRGNGLTTRLQDWLDEEVHLSRRACFGYALVVVVALSVAAITTRSNLTADLDNAATAAPVEVPAKPTKDSRKAPNRTVF